MIDLLKTIGLYMAIMYDHKKVESNDVGSRGAGFVILNTSPQYYDATPI